MRIQPAFLPNRDLFLRWVEKLAWKVNLSQEGTVLLYTMTLELVSKSFQISDPSSGQLNKVLTSFRYVN